MLITCQECGLQMSDTAVSCPHCGYIKNNTKITRQRRSKKKRLRLPNGFGQITEIKNDTLRNRFRVSITVGKTEDGKYIKKLLKPTAYFPTYNDAYNALVEYHKNPYEVSKDMTVKELYEEWSKDYFNTIADTAIRTITSAWVYCSSLYNVSVQSLRSYHIKGCMENGTVERKGQIIPASPSTKSRIKSIFNLMLDYAVEHEIADKNYARVFNLPDTLIDDINNTKRDHIPFNESELKILWKHSDDFYVKIVLILCYMGWRPQELGLIETENVDLINCTIVGGMKTKAGKNRIVPIHPVIKPFIKDFYNDAVASGRKYLIECNDSSSHKNNLRLTYDKLSYRFEKLMKDLNFNPLHRPHDGRKTFITLAKKYHVNEYAIKKIVGHEITDITERIYTERSLNWLNEEIEKIKGPVFDVEVCCRSNVEVM